MRLPDTSSLVARRQDASLHLLVRRDDSSGVTGGIIIIAAPQVAVVLGVCFAVGVFGYTILRHIRGRHSNPRYVPTQFLKMRWRAWKPSNVRRRDSSSLLSPRRVSENHSNSRATTPSANMRVFGPGTANASDPTGEIIVDRHTSVRSIMTLPEYQTEARPTEQILGREGERAGMDTVVEFPETAGEEENRREEEMDSLYRIRVARREERAAREDRRRLRAEARARGDFATLADLREQRRQERERQREENSAALVDEHNRKTRGRRVSSVNYMDIGVARHDGTRVRGDSHGSDNVPLLEDASNMSTSRPGMGPPRPSYASSGRASTSHSRNQSSLSLARVVGDDISDDDGGRSSLEGTPWASRTDLTAARTTSRDAATRTTSQDLAPRRGSSSGDLGQSIVLLANPPDYESAWADVTERHEQQRPVLTVRPPEQDLGDAPPYESPRSGGNSGNSGNNSGSLPSIQITPFTPDVSRPRSGESIWGLPSARS